MKTLYYFFPVLFMLFSCGLEEHEPYQTPFVHIMQYESTFATIDSEVSALKTYSVYLSSAPLKQNLEVTYELQVGDGLVEGRDFERVTTGDKLIFLPGIYEMPIRIRWLAYPLDLTKNNSLKIVLKSNNLGITIGLPGPDHNQSVFTITKTRG